MAKNKTTETPASVADYLQAIADEKRRKDCVDITGLFSKQTALEPRMWGPAIVGFGSYHYKYDSGHEGDAPLVAFASRSTAIVLYIPNFEGKEELLKQLGKHKVGKGCVYINKLSDVDTKILSEMVEKGIEFRKV